MWFFFWDDHFVAKGVRTLPGSGLPYSYVCGDVFQWMVSISSSRDNLCFLQLWYVEILSSILRDLVRCRHACSRQALLWTCGGHIPTSNLLVFVASHSFDRSILYFVDISGLAWLLRDRLGAALWLSGICLYRDDSPAVRMLSSADTLGSMVVLIALWASRDCFLLYTHTAVPTSSSGSIVSFSIRWQWCDRLETVFSNTIFLRYGKLLSDDILHFILGL